MIFSTVVTQLSSRGRKSLKHSRRIRELRINFKRRKILTALCINFRKFRVQSRPRNSLKNGLKRLSNNTGFKTPPPKCILHLFQPPLFRGKRCSTESCGSLIKILSSKTIYHKGRHVLNNVLLL